MSARARVLAGLGVTLLLAAAPSVRAQCPDGTPPPCGPRPARVPAPAPNSIAVLPFANRSPDTADVYLAEGMSDEVANRLTQLRRLQVKARGVVEAQWRRGADPLRAARALGVAWYVHGYVRRVPPRLVVNVELVRPATGEQVWAMRFAGPDTDVFAVQVEVAESVAVMVGGRLTPGERATLARRATRNNDAYRLFLRGNALLARRTEADARLAVASYAEAVRLDPRFAAAWGRMGMARCVQGTWWWYGPGERDALQSTVGTFAAQALLLDSLSADGWLASGCAAYQANDFWAARGAFERSLALDSLNPETWHFYGRLYGAPPSGLVDDSRAIPLLRRALAVAPTYRNSWRQIGLSALYAGRLEEAEAAFDSTLAWGPWDAAYVGRADVRFRRGDGAGALADLAAFERLHAAVDPDRRALFTVLLGDSAPARAALERLRAPADSGASDLGMLAVTAAALGRHEDALAALERLRDTPAADEPRCAPATPCSASLRTWQALHDPVFAPLRGAPRFERLWRETRPRVPWLADER